MKGSVARAITADSFERVADAAKDARPVAGWTHNFYRYPARFSPQFVRAVIEEFSAHGDLIADPYMGGGTTVVEGVALGRRVVGNDLNSLAAFVARAKTTPLSEIETRALLRWAQVEVPGIGYRDAPSRVAAVDEGKTANLTMVKARFIKKIVAGALSTIEQLPTETAIQFAKCAVLRTAQWALDGRRSQTGVSEFRSRLQRAVPEMLKAIASFSLQAARSGGEATILNMDAAELHLAESLHGKRVSLVVTSPPYPGVHVLYHRWQVDGRRESPAPYWISGCSDGKGASFYNFGDRRKSETDEYFRTSLRTLQSTRRTMKDGGYMVQMVAFNRPREQLTRYLSNMSDAGFTEVLSQSDRRIWRQVPNRKWHASLLGRTHSAREVVLVHRAT